MAYLYLVQVIRISDDSTQILRGHHIRVADHEVPELESMVIHTTTRYFAEQEQTPYNDYIVAKRKVALDNHLYRTVASHVTSNDTKLKINYVSSTHETFVNIDENKFLLCVEDLGIANITFTTSFVSIE